MDKEKIIFEMYKNRPIKNKQYFLDRVEGKFKNIDFSDLYVRIINYQIATYGHSLISNSASTFNNMEEWGRSVKSVKQVRRRRVR